MSLPSGTFSRVFVEGGTTSGGNQMSMDYNLNSGGAIRIFPDTQPLAITAGSLTLNGVQVPSASTVGALVSSFTNPVSVATASGTPLVLGAPLGSSRENFYPPSTPNDKQIGNDISGTPYKTWIRDGNLLKLAEVQLPINYVKYQVPSGAIGFTADGQPTAFANLTWKNYTGQTGGFGSWQLPLKQSMHVYTTAPALAVSQTTATTAITDLSNSLLNIAAPNQTAVAQLNVFTTPPPVNTLTSMPFYDISGTTNNNPKIWTIPAGMSGLYEVKAQCDFADAADISGATSHYLYVLKNGTNSSNAITYAFNRGNGSLSLSYMAQLNSGDLLRIASQNVYAGAPRSLQVMLVQLSLELKELTIQPKPEPVPNRISEINRQLTPAQTTCAVSVQLKNGLPDAPVGQVSGFPAAQVVATIQGGASFPLTYQSGSQTYTGTVTGLTASTTYRLFIGASNPPVQNTVVYTNGGSYSTTFTTTA